MDVVGVLLGLGLGILASGSYFAGLYVTIRATVRAQRPTALLAVSAVIRLGLFLTIGYFVTQMGLEIGLGFFVAFPLVRYVAISWGGARLEGLRAT